MKGGGDWEEYCPLCGLPFSLGYGSRYRRATSAVESLQWLTRAYGFETGGQHRVFELGEWNYDSASMSIRALRDGSPLTPEETEFRIVKVWDSEEDIRNAPPLDGIAMHQDCVHTIEAKRRGRSLELPEIIMYYKKTNKKHRGFKDLSGYNGQFFDWESATDLEIEPEPPIYWMPHWGERPSPRVPGESLPAWMLESPMVNRESADRIWNRFISQARLIHTLMSHAAVKKSNSNDFIELPVNLAAKITGMVTGLNRPHEYRPDLYRGPEGGSRRHRRHRKHCKTRRGRRSLAVSTRRRNAKGVSV